MKYVYAVLSILIPFVVILIHNEFHFFLNYMFETRQEKSKLFPFEVNNNQSACWVSNPNPKHCKCMWEITLNFER